jgi:hypothetical protein
MQKCAGSSVLQVVGVLGALAVTAILFWPSRDEQVTEFSEPERDPVLDSQARSAVNALPDTLPERSLTESVEPAIELPTDFASYREFSLQYVDLATWEAHLAKAAELGYDFEEMHSSPPDVRFESFE